MIYECGHCGFKGHCYGAPSSQGVSAPWCYQCDRNGKLTPVKEEKSNEPKGVAHDDA